MDFWNEQDDKLEKALLDGAPALVLHFLRHDHSAKIRLLRHGHGAACGVFNNQERISKR